jgi:SAM-dependent methyltransferase
MRLDRLFYRTTYRFGRPRWDTGEPRPELEALIQSRPPGRALDLGCGTGADAVYLASRGWQVVGIDFAAEAVEKARNRTREEGSDVRFLVGDVSRLRDAGVEGPFDLLLDIGCYHAIPAGRRDAYAAEVAAVARPGADLYVAGIADPPVTWRLLGASGVNGDELRKRFGDRFEIAEERRDGRGGFVVHHLVRRSDSRRGA